MATFSGTGTIWDLPNYSGDLYTADAISTPFYSAIAGKTVETPNFEFPTDSLYDHPAAAQPAITETASLTAPTAGEAIKTQNKNVTQIHHEAIAVSYVDGSNRGRLSGINTQGQMNNAPSELDFQVGVKLQKIARDIEYSFLNGAYQISTGKGVANKTRGMFELCASNTTVDASTAVLTKALLDQLLKAMFDAGAYFGDMWLFTNSTQKQLISDIYSYVPTDRYIGGSNIQAIETDFGIIKVALNRFVPADDILIADMNVCRPVEQPVVDGMKGNFFLEELAKDGASTKYQLFGQIGLDHGPGFMHGSLTNLAT